MPLGSNEASSLKAVFAGGNNFTQSPRIAWERSDIVNNIVAAWTTVATVTLPFGTTFHDLPFTMPQNCNLNAVKFRARLLTGGNCGEFVSDEIIITHGGWAQVINALTQTSTTATFPTPSYSLTARSVTHWLGTNAAATPPIDKGYVGGTLQRYRWQWRAKYFAITDGQSRFYFTPLATDRITNANTQDMTMADISFSIPSLNDIVLPANIPSNARFAELEVVATPILTYPGCTQEFVGVGTSFTITQTPPKLLANHESSIGNVAVSTSIRAMTNNPFALQIQPNPASDLVTLSFVPPEKGTYTVEILDALQRRVFTLPQTLYHQELSAQSLNLASFSNGTYTVRIFGTTEHGTFYATAQPLIIIK